MAEPVAANVTYREKASLLRNAINSYAMAAEDAMKPGGGLKASWPTAMVAAKTALDAAHTAFAAAIAASVATPAQIITPAIGYGSMTGAAGVAVAPNP